MNEYGPNYVLIQNLFNFHGYHCADKLLYIMAESEKLRYSDSDLAEFREVINKKLDQARTQLKTLHQQLLDLNTNSDSGKIGDWEEGNDSNEREYLANMADRQQRFIRDLENALVRIENKTYGICSVTGNKIDKKRLLLVPHTTKSVEGKLNQ